MGGGGLLVERGQRGGFQNDVERCGLLVGRGREDAFVAVVDDAFVGGKPVDERAARAGRRSSSLSRRPWA